MDHHNLTLDEVHDLRRALEDAHNFGQNYLRNCCSRKARLEALGAAKKLVWELETGQDEVKGRIEDTLSTLALQFMLHLKVPEKVPEEGSISISDLATAVKAEPLFLVRFMRILCATGIFLETGPDTFAHNKRSRIYSRDEGEVLEVLMREQLYPVFPRLAEYFANRPLANPEDLKQHPYGWSHDMNGHHWIDVLARNPENLAAFSKSAGIAGDFASDIFVYPFDKELKSASEKAVAQDSVLLVDVGGCTGDSMKFIRQEYPQLKGKIVVQDTPAIINKIPDGHLPDGIEPQIHDFWTPQPIKGAGAYFLRRIMHDWSDEHCQTILGHIVDAMDEQSKVLIAEVIVPERINFVDTSAYWMDLAMLSISGKERTAQNWKDLFEASGLELVKIWKPEMGSQAVIEGRKKRV